MSRRERERALLEIVAGESVSSQGELAETLASRGFDVTQATISRDLKRLGLVKVPAGDGGYRYARPDAPAEPPPAARDALRSAFAEFAVGVDEAQGIIVVFTPPGCGNAVGIAIDAAEMPGVVATLAGDDTIFVLTRAASDLRRVRRHFEELLGGG